MKEHVKKLLQERYYLRDREGNLLEDSTEELYGRVAHTIAGAEHIFNKENASSVAAEWEIKFYNLMISNKFLPNTPTLVNAGKDSPGSYGACYVLPVKDSMTGIFDAVKNSALVQKSGGGIGYNFGTLREAGAIVGSTGHTSSGPLSFMTVFNQATDTIKQGGVRRGAMIGILPVSHPDIEEFINIKSDLSKLTNFNLSVSITDSFMKAVEDNQEWKLISPHTKAVKKTINARDLWDKLITRAWQTGEPGIIFIDEINRKHPFLGVKQFEIEACNPCGELPLRNWESCTLGSMNLSEYYDKEMNQFDFSEFSQDIYTAVRFLDNVVEVNPYTLPEIEQATKETRKIGLGVMGWADLLLKLSVPYNSTEAISIIDQIGSCLKDYAYDASLKLGVERGNFPAFYASSYCDEKTPAMRNATRTCIAPAGTISRISETSSGIEPIFAFKTDHNLEGLSYVSKHWALDKYSVNDPWMVTASDISYEWHLAHQIEWQKYIDSAVSKTINLPNEATKTEVDAIFLKAWKGGLKGITVYRNGSRNNQPLTASETKSDTPEIKDEYFTKKDIVAMPTEHKTTRTRGHIAFGPTHKVDTGNGKCYVTINYSREEDDPVEVFIRLGPKSTSVENELAEYCGRLISVMLKNNIPLESILRQGRKVYGENGFWYNKHSYKSLPQLISHLLGFSFNETLEMLELDDTSYDPEDGWDVIDEQESPVVFDEPIETIGDYCYKCEKFSVIRESGCKVCVSCGESTCG